MSSLIESLVDMLSGDALGKISQQIGIPKEKAQQAMPGVISVLTGALAKNSSKPEGAQALFDALSKDHDGSVLNNLSTYIGNYQSGEGSSILGHVLGDKRTAVEKDLSQKTGIDTDSIGNLLTMAAPLIMGILGKTQKQQSLDLSSLTDLLGKEQNETQKRAPVEIDISNNKQKSQPTFQRQVPQKKKVDILDISKVKIPQDVFDIAEERLLSDPDRYKSTNFRCQFDIAGENGGQWYIVINNEKQVVSKGILENPVSTVIMKEPDFIKLVLGKLNAPVALLTGSIKIKGDINHIIKLVETLMA